MTEDDVARTLERLPALVNGDAALVRRGRTLTAPFLVGAGSIPVHLSVREGMIESVTRGPALMRSWRFAIRAGAEAWQRFWEPMPLPGYHDLLAMSRFGTAAIEGDLLPLMQHLRYVKEVLEAPRRAGGDGLHNG